MNKEHLYHLNIKWTGNKGQGTSGYRSYERSHTISAGNKPLIPGSSDPSFRGDTTCYSPEELLVASVSGCHMLWFLHLCADNQIVVTDYSDTPIGKMVEDADGGGRFTEITLKPHVKVSEPGMLEKLNELHKRARSLCFIANSVNFEVKHIPTAESV
jgi:organic hydroperoxide reductase OsmC/OhrA